MLFGWRNDPDIVRRGSLQKTVTPEEHAEWFISSLAAPHERRLFVVEHSSREIGLVRFDRMETGEALIGVYLAGAHTGKGLGVAAIRAGCRDIGQCWDVTRVYACVRDDNPAAKKAFEKAGFAKADDAPCPAGHTGYRYEL